MKTDAWSDEFLENLQCIVQSTAGHADQQLERTLDHIIEQGPEWIERVFMATIMLNSQPLSSSVIPPCTLGNVSLLALEGGRHILPLLVEKIKLLKQEEQS